MSKSRGNLVFVSKLLAAGNDPMAVRLAIISHHYRADWDWTQEALAAAAARLATWRAAVAAAPRSRSGDRPVVRVGPTRRAGGCSRRSGNGSPTTSTRPAPSPRSTSGRQPPWRASPRPVTWYAQAVDALLGIALWSQPLANGTAADHKRARAYPAGHPRGNPRNMQPEQSGELFRRLVLRLLAIADRSLFRRSVIVL